MSVVEISDEDESSNDLFSVSSGSEPSFVDEDEDTRVTSVPRKPRTANIVINLVNRQIYGRFTKNPRAKTEKVFNDVHPQCRFKLSSLVDREEWENHVFMGFTICGQFCLSFTQNMLVDNIMGIGIEYDLHVWRFSPGQKLKFVSKHRIFKCDGTRSVLGHIMFTQFPMDPYKLVCYGMEQTSPPLSFITILTLPFPKSCKHCYKNVNLNNLGWCAKHGFILHCSFTLSQPPPAFDPQVSLSYPNHLIVHTGHLIHVVNLKTLEPPKIVNKEKSHATAAPTFCNFNDALSEVSGSFSGANSVVDGILEDFNEYDTEGNDGSKPFHELNISCEPLNVSGKKYHNTVKRGHSNNSNKDEIFPQPSIQKRAEKFIDKKTAEKAYEFTEENEKCEKLSSFRKKRLAEKKYEFSEDNSENITPFNSLRKERRFSRQNKMRSGDLSSLFLSPRSPMQSPNSRNGQFSPGGARSLHGGGIRNSPHHSISPISPRESARKFYVYSPSLDSDCSDTDSRLILRMSNSCSNGQPLNPNCGLLILTKETPKWINKVVRRYSNWDNFENSSLLSGQSKDDYNIPIEIPFLVQKLNEQHLDVVPEYKADQITETQLIVTQRTLDIDQFVLKHAYKLCADWKVEFLHCKDYDIRIIYVCPLSGQMVCRAVITMGVLHEDDDRSKPHLFIDESVFTWNILTGAFEVFDSSARLVDYDLDNLFNNLPKVNCQQPLVQEYKMESSSMNILRDFNNFYEVCLGDAPESIVLSSESSVESMNIFQL